VDPKKVELTLFNKIERHFLAKLPGAEEAIITDTKKVIHTLNSLCIEMDNRYTLLKEAGVRNLKEYNAKFVARKLNPEKGHYFMPYIVLVIDEIQSGFARTGRMFAIEHSGVEPDLMTLAKSLAGGFPLAAVVGKASIMDAPGPGGLGGTYAGSPIACAAGLAVLEERGVRGAIIDAVVAAASRASELVAA
jgi:hypothetical protein